MIKTEGTITTDDGLIQTSDALFAYSEEEKQQNEINATNASIPFEPTFIPVFPHIQRHYNLSDTDAKLYGFIWFYLSNSSKRFYFTNEQLAHLLCCSESSVKRSIKSLQDNDLCIFSYRIKASGGTIRFIDKFIGTESRQVKKTSPKKPTGQIDPPDRSKRPAVYYNNNKVNNNIYTNTNVLVSLDKIPLKRKIKPYSVLEDLLESDLEEIAREYSVPLAFVKSKLDDMKNYTEARGIKYVNYKAQLRAWVKKEAIERRESAINRSKIAFVGDTE